MSVDPSYMDFSGGNSSGYDPSSSWSSQYAPTASTDTSQPAYSPSGDLSPVDTSQAVNQGRWNQLEAQHNINATDAASNPDPGVLKGALSALGSNQGTEALKALTSILTAAGHYNQAKAYAKLPGMPSMGGPLPALPGMGGSTGYGPAGGYNYKNYAGLAAGAPGTGYAPRTQAAPPASYYTYGQGPEQQFFQQVNPQGGTIAPVPHKRGGRVKKYAMGGMVPQGPMAQNGAMSRPTIGQPMPSPMSMPMSNPMAPNQRPGMRPFAAGGRVPHFDAGGAASYNNMMNTINAGNIAADQKHGKTWLDTHSPEDIANGSAIGEALSPPYNPNAHPVTKFSAAVHAAHDAGYAGGGQNQGALSQPTQGSRYVQGPGDGTSDDIPARLANGEYVLSADVVSGLGNGDNSSGAKVLDGFVHSLRTHKAQNAAKGKLPADAKPIQHYMKGGR